MDVQIGRGKYVKAKFIAQLFKYTNKPTHMVP